MQYIYKAWHFDVYQFLSERKTLFPFTLCSSCKQHAATWNMFGKINWCSIASIQNCKRSNFTVKRIQTLLSVASTVYLCLSAINEPCVLNITNGPASISWVYNWLHDCFLFRKVVNVTEYALVTTEPEITSPRARAERPKTMAAWYMFINLEKRNSEKLKGPRIKKRFY